MFAKSLYDQDVQVECSYHDDGQRVRCGMPDHPFSLMEGIAGEVCFLSDILGDEN